MNGPSNMLQHLRKMLEKAVGDQNQKQKRRKGNDRRKKRLRRELHCELSVMLWRRGRG